MKRKLTSGLLVLALSLATTSTFYSCKDYNEDASNDLRAEYSTLQDALAALQSKVNALKSCECSTTIPSNVQAALDGKADAAALNAKADQASLDALRAANETSINTINASIEELQNGATNSAQVLQQIQDSLAIVAARANLIYNYVGENGTELLAAVEDLNNWRQALGARDFTNVLDSITTAYVTAQKNSEWIANYDGVSSQALKDSCEAIRQEALVLYMVALGTSADYTDTKIEGVNASIESIKTQLDAKDVELSDKISELRTDYNTLNTKVSELDTKINLAFNRITALQNYINGQITSLNVNATSSPMTLDATIALPIGVQSNMLIAYYGSNTSGNLKFPMVADGVLASDITDVEGTISDLKGESFESTAGKLYFTVNPSNIDITGANLKLTDSQNNPAGIQLNNIKKSDRTLRFSVTRAADNGFYEADAYITDVNAAKLNTDGLKSAASQLKTFIQNKSGIMSTSAGVLRGVMASVKVPAYALQAEHNYTDADGVAKTNYVHSNYEIAAVAVHPLSYNVNVENYTGKIPEKYLPHIDYISSLINEKLDSIKGKLNFKFDAPEFSFNFNVDLNIDFGQITLQDVSINVPVDVPFNAEATVNIDKTVQATYEKPVITKIYDEDGNFKDVQIDYETATIDVPVQITQTVPVSGSASTTVSTSVSMEQISQQINDQIIAKIQSQLKETGEKLNGQFTNLSTDLNKQIGDMLNNMASNINGQISGVLDEISGFGATADGYIDRVNSYINRINNILTKGYGIINNANYYMKPIMFIGGNNMSRISPSYGTATRIKANAAVLYPTSWFAETINPSYKKLVKVTNVWKADGTLDEAAKTKANSAANMNKVVDGTVRAIALDVDSSNIGETYELLYVALDYSGNQYATKYYVKVVD